MYPIVYTLRNHKISIMVLTFKSSLLPRPDRFESSLLPRPNCFERMNLYISEGFSLYNYYSSNLVYLIDYVNMTHGKGINNIETGSLYASVIVMLTV